MSQEPRLSDLAGHARRGFFWRALGVYLLGSWVALQVVDVLAESAGLPPWFPTFALALLVIGLPIVLATAIVQQGVLGGAASDRVAKPAASDGGPDDGPTTGLASGTGSLDRPSTRPPRLHRLLTWKNAVTGGVVAFALWGMLAAVWLGLSSWVAGPEDAAPASVETSEDVLKAIAVLPFENLSADADNAYFADGIHEDVLTQLSKIADLTVISRTSVMPYRDSDLSLGEIAAELGVGSILEGSVRRAGDNVRITAQLIDASTDQHMWADNFDRGLTAANVFAIQTEIARQIADALQATLSPEEETRIASVPTTDLTAYDLYIRGREAYQRYVADDNERAVTLFKEAIASDPGYAEPWAGLADAYGQRVQLFAYPLEWADSTEVLARRAIDLGPESSVGYKALAFAMTMHGRVRESLEANLDAIARDPNHYAAVNNAGFNYEHLGRFDEAIKWYKRASRLNPGSAFGMLNAAAAYALLGEQDLARRILADEAAVLSRQVNYGIMVELHLGQPQVALELADANRSELWDVPIFLAFDAAARTAAGDLEGARESAERAFELSPGASLFGIHFDLQTRLGYATMHTGVEAEGRAILEDRAATIRAQLDAGADRPALFWELGAIRAAFGESEEAIALAIQAREAGLQPADGYLEIEPMMAAVRDDPRIVAMVEESRRDVEQQRLSLEAEEIAAGER